MKLRIYETPENMGIAAAKETAETLNAEIEKSGGARILLSTGASQFEYLTALVAEQIDWSKVEMFHLDEYVGIGEEHKASFVKYLKERFVQKVNLKKAHFVNGEGNVIKNIATLTKVINEKPIDVGLIGIGENAHIAFNDPPADFDDGNAYKIVRLADKCKEQQVREGWFESPESVCKEAITMTCKQIMKCLKIISVVPHGIKAIAVRDTLQSELDSNIPATLLKKHEDFTLYCDEKSIALTPADIVRRYQSL